MSEADAGRRVARLYAPVAAEYGRLWAPLLAPYSLQLLDHLPLPQARSVLDLGCGVGTLLPELRARAPSSVVVGADRTLEMIRLADGSFHRVALDAFALPFADGSFDVVVMAFVIFYLPDPARAFIEVRRVLRSGGVIGIATWTAEERFPAQDAWDEELDAAGAPPDDGADVGEGLELTDTPEKLQALLDQAGFRTVASQCLPFEEVWTREAFIEMQMKIGWTSRRRLELTSTTDRESFLATVRRRIASLADEDLVDRSEVILAVGRAPAAASPDPRF